MLESNWRWNVWATGWYGGPFGLIARTLQPYPFYAIARYDGTPGSYLGAVCLGPDLLNDTWAVFSPTEAYPHFPFQFPVEPD